MRQLLVASVAVVVALVVVGVALAEAVVGAVVVVVVEEVRREREVPTCWMMTRASLAWVGSTSLRPRRLANHCHLVSPICLGCWAYFVV